jgi:iron complex transport system ATP-binding protein
MLLAQQPSVVLLDEPTTYLDLHNQFRVLDLVETLCDETGMTVLVVLHDIAQASRVADWLVALHDGTVYDRGPPAAVISETMIRDVFGVEADVEFDSSGPSIRPLGHIERDEHPEGDA